MGLILCLILLACGYAALLPSLLRRLSDGRSKLLGVTVSLVIYGCFSGVLLMIFATLDLLDNASVMITVLLGLGSTAGIAMFLRQHGRELNPLFTAALALYFLALVYICIFSRFGEERTEVNTDVFAALQSALSEGTLLPLQHFFLNMILFLPVGILIPLICPGQLFRLLQVLAPAALISTAIEAIQMVFRLGNCDLEDITANILGAACGFLLLRLFFTLEGEESPDEEPAET